MSRSRFTQLASRNSTHAGRYSALSRGTVAPRKHPSERAQDRPLAPTIGSAAAMHSSHRLDEAADDGKKQVETQHVARCSARHVASRVCCGTGCLQVWACATLLGPADIRTSPARPHADPASRSASALNHAARPGGPSTTTSDNSLRASSSVEAEHTRSPATPADASSRTVRNADRSPRSSPAKITWRAPVSSTMSATRRPYPCLARGSPTPLAGLQDQPVPSGQFAKRTRQLDKRTFRIGQQAGMHGDGTALILDPGSGQPK